MLTYKDRKQRQKEERAREKANKDAREVLESLKNFLHGQKYRNPRDENELGFNRGIRTAIRVIDDDFL